MNVTLKHLKLPTVTQVATSALCASSASHFLGRLSVAFLSSLTHATIKLQPPTTHTLSYQAPGSIVAVFQPSISDAKQPTIVCHAVRPFSRIATRLGPLDGQIQVQAPALKPIKDSTTMDLGSTVFIVLRGVTFEKSEFR